MAIAPETSYKESQGKFFKIESDAIQFVLPLVLSVLLVVSRIVCGELMVTHLKFPVNVNSPTIEKFRTGAFESMPIFLLLLSCSLHAGVVSENWQSQAAKSA